ncbi:TetR/AcrR family transcriptional regulator [Actinoplanes sp. TBRC 11911]|uniref:TetR/AcrR family transcriptional regulator n=1 Tax=Actinoplanes sp. TBRC 11911 TaxID=2729386 RepID=UPI00145E6F49|nr:TetR/AcrR family transcriptional regulator [Actinoplanes sp. TBRC 11911]NMO57713.1 TetR/AcrR family transcriptional regulator [Actinoplanes sp. TBRC 11911]
MPANAPRSLTPVARRAATEAAVLAAAERLLAGGASFTELGIGQIAAEAGIARPTFYLYFADKTQLMLRLVETLGGALDRSATTIELDELIRAYRAGLAFFRERRHVIAAVLEVAGYDPAVREAWNAIMQRFVQREVDLLRAEQDAGRTPADLDVETAAEIINWGGAQVIVRQVTMRGPERDDIVARELAEHRYYGAYRRPGS